MCNHLQEGAKRIFVGEIEEMDSLCLNKSRQKKTSNRKGSILYSLDSVFRILCGRIDVIGVYFLFGRIFLNEENFHHQMSDKNDFKKFSSSAMKGC